MAMSTLGVRLQPDGNSHVSKAHAQQLRRLADDEKIAEQKQTLKDDAMANMYASWSESLQESSHKSLKQKNTTIKEEIRLANKALIEVRRAQLRELLQTEQSQVEEELHSLGLAIHKERL